MPAAESSGPGGCQPSSADTGKDPERVTSAPMRAFSLALPDGGQSGYVVRKCLCWRGVVGLGHIELQFLLNEHRYRPIGGEVLAIGRQSTGFSLQLALQHMKGFGIEKRDDAVIAFDTN